MMKADVLWRAMALLGFTSGIAALALSLTLWNRAASPSESAPRVQPPAPSKASVELTGRTATISRLLSERRAVARGFGASGALSIACRAESADGGTSACFGAETGSGTWSLASGRLCIEAAALQIPAGTCYELSGEPPHLVLAGPGILAGNMLLR